MAFPEPDDKIVYDNNPLVEVEAALLLSPILAVERDRGAAFQGLIREDYPYCVHEGEPLAQFVSREATWMSTLEASRIGLATTVYDRWVEFRHKLEALGSAFVEAYGAPELTGLQLRYRDVIDPETLSLADGQWSWGDLIDQPLCGLLASGDIGGQIQRAFSRTELELETCPGRLRIQHGLERMDDGRSVFVIDSLFFSDFEGELDDGYRQLDSYRALASNVFRWAITDRLHDALEPRTVDN